MATPKPQPRQCTDGVALQLATAVRERTSVIGDALRFLSEYTEVGLPPVLQNVISNVMPNQPLPLVDRPSKRERPTAGGLRREKNGRKRTRPKRVKSTEGSAKIPKTAGRVEVLGESGGSTLSSPVAFSSSSSSAYRSSNIERWSSVSSFLPLPPPPPDGRLLSEAGAPARGMVPPPPPPSAPLSLYAEHGASGCGRVQRLPLSRFSVAWNAEGVSSPTHPMGGDAGACEPVRTLCVALPLHVAESCHDCRSAAAWVATSSQSRACPEGLYPVSSSFFRVGLGEQYLFFVKFASVREAKEAFIALRCNKVYCIWAKQDSGVRKD